METKNIMIDSLKFPFINFKQSLILMILFLGSFLIIPGILGAGYLLRIIEASSNGSNEPPQFNEWKLMFKEGLKYVGATIILLGIPTFLLMSKGVNIDGNNVWSNINLILLNLVLYYLFIMAIGHMAHEKRFKSFFNVRNIFRLITKLGKGRYFILVAIYSLIDTVISDIFSLSVLGTIELWILFFVSLSFLLIFQSRLSGLVYLTATSHHNKEKI